MRFKDKTIFVPRTLECVMVHDSHHKNGVQLERFNINLYSNIEIKLLNKLDGFDRDMVLNIFRVLRHLHHYTLPENDDFCYGIDMLKDDEEEFFGMYDYDEDVADYLKRIYLKDGILYKLMDEISVKPMSKTKFKNRAKGTIFEPFVGLYTKKSIHAMIHETSPYGVGYTKKSEDDHFNDYDEVFTESEAMFTMLYSFDDSIGEWRETYINEIYGNSSYTTNIYAKVGYLERATMFFELISKLHILEENYEQN